MKYNIFFHSLKLPKKKKTKQKRKKQKKNNKKKKTKKTKKNDIFIRILFINIRIGKKYAIKVLQIIYIIKTRLYVIINNTSICYSKNILLKTK